MMDRGRAQLLYLNYESASKPVYMYINTPGTSTPDGRAIGFETEAFAISDCMNYIKPPVYTIGVGQVRWNWPLGLARVRRCFCLLPFAFCPTFSFSESIEILERQRQTSKDLVLPSNVALAFCPVYRRNGMGRRQGKQPIVVEMTSPWQWSKIRSSYVAAHIHRRRGCSLYASARGKRQA